MEKTQLTHDTYKFSFKLPEEDQVIGLPVGGHVFFHFTDTAGEVISRKYTPISTVNERGKVSFVIKVYAPTAEFPNGGVMSMYLSKLNVGDKIKIEGPKGLLFYHGKGNFVLKGKPISKKKIGLIAGGTGITPCY
jgi:NAD(P)H-flavin reductase